VAPRSARDFELPVSVARLAADDILELTVRDRDGHEFWKWVVPGNPLVEPIADPQSPVERRDSVITAGDYTLEFDPATGELARLTAHGRQVPLRGPRLADWQRAAKLKSFTHAERPRLVQLELAPAPGLIARARYEGELRDVTWRLQGDELIVSYEIAREGAADILGIQFDYPESDLLSKRWVGAGPYRIWKNRVEGTQFGLHAADYSRSTPGESFEYPEFEGFFGEWRWLEMRTRGGVIAIRNASRIPYFGLYRPTPVATELLSLPDLGWSFLHAVPPIGTKFALPDVLGPQSQPAQFTGTLRGELAIAVLR
jgi:hypothetical protein